MLEQPAIDVGIALLFRRHFESKIRRFPKPIRLRSHCRRFSAFSMLFGSLPVIAKVVLTEVPAVALVGIRVLIAALVLLAFQVYRKRIWLSNRKDYLRLAVLGFFGVVLNQLLFIGGLSLTKASNVSLLVITIPIFTFACERAHPGTGTIECPQDRRGRLGRRPGAIILIDPANASFSSATTIGDLMIILNSLAFMHLRRDVERRSSRETVPFRSMMWVFIFSSIICTPLAIYSLSSVSVAAVSSQTWALVLYISIFATALPYLLNAFAISRVSRPPSPYLFICNLLSGSSWRPFFLTKSSICVSQSRQY
jgi:drug/metabolite transporter (DMT)-like permease